jgi:hypothetical protein
MDSKENLGPEYYVCTHQFHSNSNYPERIPDEAYILSHCLKVECDFLKLRKPNKRYPERPPGVVFYKNLLSRK